MKRDREDLDDRDPSEVRQQRTGGNGKGRGGKQERIVRPPRMAPNLDTDAGEPQMKVEFTILRGMVGAVIGRGGNTVQGIRNRTGATVHIHSTTPKDKETNVELNGTRKQIEEAYDDLRAVMSTVDEEYTESHDPFARASLELRTLPKMIGCLIGKAGSKIKSIEEGSGAKVKVEQPEGDEFQDVLIYGNLDSVCKAHEMVLDALQSFDPSRAKTTRRSMAPTQGSVQAQSMNVVDLSAQSLIGSSLVKGQIAPMVPSQQQQQQSSLVIQTPPGGLAPVPTVLVLQADGTYLPAQVVSQMSNSSATITSYPNSHMAASPMALNSIPSQQPAQQNVYMQQQPLQHQVVLASQQASNLQQQTQQVPQQHQKQPATLQLQPGIQQQPQQQSNLLQQIPQSMLQQYTLAVGGNAGHQQPQQLQQQPQQLPNGQFATFFQHQHQQMMPTSAPGGNAAFLMDMGLGVEPAAKVEPGNVKMELGDSLNGILPNPSVAGVALGMHGSASQGMEYGNMKL